MRGQFTSSNWRYSSNSGMRDGSDLGIGINCSGRLWLTKFALVGDHAAVISCAAENVAHGRGHGVGSCICHMDEYVCTKATVLSLLGSGCSLSRQPVAVRCLAGALGRRSCSLLICRAGLALPEHPAST